MTSSTTARLLVVDDQPAVREILAAMLTLGGYEVTAVGMGSQAIQLLGERPFDLVLVDVNMPGANGWQVLDRAQALSPAPPVLMISDERYEAEALRRGAGFLGKPYRRSVVEESVRQMLAAS
ncbi:MAG: response regulator [Dehalococcoidia bacterium]|nr:response regulator [Dehalococcoidia bacterium]